MTAEKMFNDLDYFKKEDDDQKILYQRYTDGLYERVWFTKRTKQTRIMTDAYYVEGNTMHDVGAFVADQPHVMSIELIQAILEQIKELETIRKYNMSEAT